MFDVFIIKMLGFLLRSLWMVLGTIWQHPLLWSVICLAAAAAYLIDEETCKRIQVQYEWLYAVLQQRMHTVMLRRRRESNYSMAYGPHTWQCQTTSCQSPINIDETTAKKLGIRELVSWHHYDDLPESIELENTGQMLVLRANFRGNTPTVSGADLLSCYSFVEMHFHWGWCNNDGSEHTLNHKKYPMEMQVMHRAGSSGPRSQTSSYDLLMIGYMFELSAHNPLLDPLVQNLMLVQEPGKKARIAPFPLSYLIYTFRAGFYSYGGSLTQPPCYKGAEWFIFPETLAISDFQLRHFRQLLNSSGTTTIMRNSRPVQTLGSRIVNLNYFCPFNAGQLTQLRASMTKQLEREQKDNAAAAAAVVAKAAAVPKAEAAARNLSAQVDEEGEVVEVIDTTTTIMSNSGTSICTTTMKFMDQSSEAQHCPSSLPNSIVIISSSSDLASLSGGDNISCNEKDELGIKPQLTHKKRSYVSVISDGL